MRQPIDYTDFFASPKGKEVLMDFCNRCGVFSTTFVSGIDPKTGLGAADPLASAF